jgi:CheY-like chemotaxis protein
MPRGGLLVIQAEDVRVDGAAGAGEHDVPPGRYVMLAVTDTGHGMDADTCARVFEPFFTTRAPGQGTGLGLATVYGIVRQSGGTISVESELGRGATFRLYFPRAAGQAVARATPGSHPARTLGHETVLLVEDDERVRASVASMLRRGGLQVILAANGGEALNICENHTGTIHLLLTDVVMPKLNGRKVAERLTASRPGLRVLFMSGYTADALHGHDAGTDFIAKPVTASVLLAKVHEVLARAG